MVGMCDQQKKSDLNGSLERPHLEADAGDVKITRRRMLAVTGGLAALAAARPAAAEAPILTVPTRSNETMEIMRIGSRPSGKGPTEYFTGSVRIDPLIQAPDPARIRGGSVTFEPGARTAWHTHPLGQTLIVTAGCGWVQREGGPVEEIRPGDVVWFSPGEKHWHGAAATTGMTHIALQEALNGKVVDWMEKVSDEQYRR
jgi:quercetin dioxygenase-like cupin family protein